MQVETESSPGRCYGLEALKRPMSSGSTTGTRSLLLGGPRTLAVLRPTPAPMNDSAWERPPPLNFFLCS